MDGIRALARADMVMNLQIFVNSLQKNQVAVDRSKSLVAVDRPKWLSNSR
jgi:hypothetical protein